MTALSGGQNLVQTRRSNGGSSKSEMQRHGRMVSDKVGRGSQREKSVYKNGNLYTQSEVNGAALFEAYNTWELQNGIFWLTKHPEDYKVNSKEIQFEDFD